MPRELGQPAALDGLVLPDARTGRVVDLGALPGKHVLTAIRHRF